MNENGQFETLAHWTLGSLYLERVYNETVGTADGPALTIPAGVKSWVRSGLVLRRYEGIAFGTKIITWRTEDDDAFCRLVYRFTVIPNDI